MIGDTIIILICREFVTITPNYCSICCYPGAIYNPITICIGESSFLSIGTTITITIGI